MMASSASGVATARKRERENPCGVCGHYHKYEEGEVCGICGHRMPDPSHAHPSSLLQLTAFASEIFPDFLFLGTYDNASRSELLKTQGISRILNTVPSCTNLYKNSFTYFCLKDDKSYPFADAIQFLEQCEKDRARVLVHCMTGKNRSPAIVIAYLMKCKGWRLTQSYQWVKERRPSVEIQQEVYQQLLDYEQKIFGSSSSSSQSSLNFPPPSLPTFSFGFPKAEGIPAPTFSTGTGTGTGTGTSIFDCSSLNVPPSEFTFGAGQTAETPLVANQANQNAAGDIPMDGA